MPIEFVEQDDLDEVEERLQARIDEIDIGGGFPMPVGAWEDATADVLWGFKGLREWPDLGSGGEYKVYALVSGNSVTLEVYGKMGSAVTWPSESAWYFYLPEELQPTRRSVGKPDGLRGRQGNDYGGQLPTRVPGDGYTPVLRPLLVLEPPGAFCGLLHQELPAGHLG